MWRSGVSASRRRGWTAWPTTPGPDGHGSTVRRNGSAWWRPSRANPPTPPLIGAIRSWRTSPPTTSAARSQIGRILAAMDLKPHRVRYWISRRDDPYFWESAADVCGLYLKAPDNAVVLSVDE